MDVTTDSLSAVFMRLESLYALVVDNPPELAKLTDIKIGTVVENCHRRDNGYMADVKADLVTRWDTASSLLSDGRDPKFCINGYMFYEVSRYAIRDRYDDQQRAKYEAQRVHNMLNHKEATHE